MQIQTILPRVIRQKDTNQQTDLNPDPYFQKVVKYIPGEIVAFYLVFNQFALNEGTYSFLILFLIAIILTPLYKYFGLKDQANILTIPWFQIIISTIALVIWIFALEDMKIIIGEYSPFIAALTLAAFTLTTPILEKLFQGN